MEHALAQEEAWNDLLATVKSALECDYSVDASTCYLIKITKRSKPGREVILNFCGSELSIHYEEEGPRALPQPVGIEENGILLDVRNNSWMSQAQIVSQIRTYLAA